MRLWSVERQWDAGHVLIDGRVPMDRHVLIDGRVPMDVHLPIDGRVPLGRHRVDRDPDSLELRVRPRLCGMPVALHTEDHVGQNVISHFRLQLTPVDVVVDIVDNLQAWTDSGLQSCLNWINERTVKSPQAYFISGPNTVGTVYHVSLPQTQTIFPRQTERPTNKHTLAFLSFAFQAPSYFLEADGQASSHPRFEVQRSPGNGPGNEVAVFGQRSAVIHKNRLT